MFKKLALLLTGLLSASALQAATLQVPDYVTSPPVTAGVLTITPHTPDLSRNPIVIGKIIYDPYDTIFTTLTLQLVQDEKGKVVGSARFQTNRPSTGRPEVTFPLDIPIVGKIKGGEIKLKGKQQIIAESEGGRKKRNVSLNITGSLIGFAPGEIDLENIKTFDDLQSEATYRFAVSVGGLGYDYDYVQDAVNKGRYLFIYQVLPPDEALGLKFPKGGDLYKVWTPWGTTLAKGYVAVDEQLNTVLTLKGKKFQYTGIQFGGNGSDPFEPNSMFLKTSYSQVTVGEPDLLTLLGFFEVFDGGTR